MLRLISHSEFVQDTTDDFDWIFQAGIHASSGPAFDISYQSLYGNYHLFLFHHLHSGTCHLRFIMFFLSIKFTFSLVSCNKIAFEKNDIMYLLAHTYSCVHLASYARGYCNTG